MIPDPTIRFFVPEGEGRDGPRYGGRPFSYAVARLRTRRTGPEDWVIVTDEEGQLYRVRPDRVALLPPSIQTELANFELLFKPLDLDVEQLHLMSVESVEPGADLEGLNDPVYLRGTLVGPFPSSAPEAITGRLTVTRGDLLAAILRGAGDAFPSSVPAGTAVVPARWHHLILPAGGEEDLRGGRGIVLAVPISRTGLELGQPGNQDQVEELLLDLLSALRADAVRARVDSPLARLTLPREGGLDLAAPAAQRGFLGRLFGGDRTKRAAPGPTGLPELLALAAEALEHLPGWPNPRARALEARVRVREAEWSPKGRRGLRPRPAPSQVFGPDGAAVTRAKKQRGPLSFTIAVEPAFATWHRGALEVEVEAGDDHGAIDLEYDGPDGTRRSAGGPTQLGGTRSLRKLSFSVPHVRFLAGDPAPVPQDRSSPPPAPDEPSLRVVLEGGDLLRIRGVRARSSTPELPAPSRRAPVPVPEPPAAPPPPPAPAPARAPAPASAPGPSAPPRRVFLHDPRFPEGWVHDRARIAAAAERRGFTILGAEPLERWVERTLAAGAAPGSVVILPGVAPDTIVESCSRTCALRRYLDAGGRVVWIGDTPLQERIRADGTSDSAWTPGHGPILDLGPPGPPLKGPVILTDDGTAWGLRVPDLAQRPHRTGEVSIVLSRAPGRWAASWLKNYQPRNPKSGFLRLRAGVFRGSDDALIEDLLRAATHDL